MSAITTIDVPDPAWSSTTETLVILGAAVVVVVVTTVFHFVRSWLAADGSAVQFPISDLARFTALLVAGLSVSGLTNLAARLAGSRRPVLQDEWRAHLSGESGYDPVTWPKFSQALGFLASAIRFRLADTAELAWRPADAVLGSRFLSNLFVWGPVIAVLVAITHHDGRFGLVADDQDPAALGAFLYGAIRTGRWWRGVKPPEPKARRARQ